jgi:transposase
MSSAPFQEELFTHPTAISGTVFVNDRVCIQTEEDQRVISVHGVIFSHYSINDRAAEAYAMVLLFESGYADQNDIARGFGYSVRSLRRYQERLKAGGLSALARPRGRPSGRKKTLERDQIILRLKTKGMSNRWVAGRLGLSETAVRKSLLRLGWKSDSAPDAQPALPFLREAASQTKGATVRVNKVSEIPSLAAGQPPRKTAPFHHLLWRQKGDRFPTNHVRSSEVTDSIKREKRQEHRISPTEVHARYTAFPVHSPLAAMVIVLSRVLAYHRRDLPESCKRRASGPSSIRKDH